MFSSLKRLLLLIGLIVVILIALLAFGFVGTHLELNRRAAVNDELNAIERRLRDDAGDAEALDILLVHLRAKSAFERAQAASSAGRIGPHAAATADDMARLLSGDDADAAREAALALGKIGPAASEAAPALIDAIKRHPDTDIGWFAAESLGAIADVDDSAARDCLNKALAHPRYLLSANAARGLKSLDDRSLAAATSRPAR